MSHPRKDEEEGKLFFISMAPCSMCLSRSDVKLTRKLLHSVTAAEGFKMER